MKRILVCLDHSAQSSHVFTYAKAFAEREHGQVTLLHVVSSDDGLTLPGVTHSSAITARLEEATRELRELADQLPATERPNVIADVGEPWRVICRVAREISADLILIGAHRMHGLEHVFGTTASHVVQKADRSVLVIRKTPRE